jgi:hypothetical protein
MFTVYVVSNNPDLRGAPFNDRWLNLKKKLKLKPSQVFLQPAESQCCLVTSKLYFKAQLNTGVHDVIRNYEPSQISRYQRPVFVHPWLNRFSYHNFKNP